MITFSARGDFKNLERFLKKMSKGEIFRKLDGYGRQGVAALASATPSETGATAAAWSYSVTNSNGGWTIAWENDNIVDGRPIVILLQYGHGTGTGGYVQGRDFINPAIKPIFDKIAEGVWQEVTQA